MGSTPRAQELDLDAGAGGSFGAAGFAYLPGFVLEEEEARLLSCIEALSLVEAPYKEYTARRRIASFGATYDFSASRLEPGPPIPSFLLSLRQRAAAVLGRAEADVPHALVTEYRPGTRLGWHRDTPEFGMIFGVSLGGTARMRFRPWPPRKGGARSLSLDLAPRSAYVLRDEARWGWQHSIAPTPGLRYSITFRTLRT